MKSNKMPESFNSVTMKGITKMAPAYHTIDKIDSLIQGFRTRGVGKEIVRLKPEELDPCSEAVWRGREYELALETTESLPRFVIRTLGGSLIRSTSDPREYLKLISEFIVKEG